MMNEDDTPRTDLPLDIPSIHDEEKAVKEDMNEEDTAGTGYVPYHPYPYPYPVPPIPPAHWTDEYQVSFAHCVLEFPNRNIFPAVAKKGKLYVAWDTNKIYRWDGKTYVELSGGGGSPVAALASLTLTQGGRTLGVFNPSGNDKSIDIPFPTIPTVPTRLSQLQNDVGYITSVLWDEVSNKPNFATVATTGDYNDLINKPEIPVLPQFATVATTGQYSDLIGSPTIPEVPEKVSAFENDAGYITADDIPEVPAPGNGTLTIKQGDTTLGTFSANAGQDAEINIPTQAIPEQVNADWEAEDGVSQILNKPGSETATQGGTKVSLVTTGEKFIWNGKQDALTDPQVVALDWAIEYRQQILATEALGRYTVSTSGSATRIADEATSITLTATVTTKFKNANNTDILVDAVTPSGWTKTAIGTYTKSIEGATGTVASAVFKYTVEGEVNNKYEAIEVSKNSDAKSISVTYPIYYGFTPTNSMSGLIADGVLDISSLHLTRGTAKVSNASATLTNGLSGPGYYWILTHGNATATQVGTSILNNPESISKLRSPQNGHADIEMTGYKLYISSNSVSAGGAIDRVALTINI